MTELFLAYAKKDGDAIEFVADGLRRAGYAVSTGYASDGQPKAIEEAALDIKRAAAVLPLLTGGSDESEELRRLLRASLLYEKPMVAARLDEAAQTGVYAGDRALIAGTQHEDEPETLTQLLERAIDLYETKPGGESGEIGFKGDSASYLGPGAASKDPKEVSHLVAALRAKGVEPRLVSKGAAEAREPAPCDSLGLPKSSEAMLAHWRLIAKDGGTRDFKRFADDYSDDPYFASLAADAKQRLRRKSMMRGFNIAADSVFGMIVAGALAYGAYGVFCDAGQCGVSSANAAVQVVPSGAVDARQFMRVQRVAENAVQAARQMQAQLAQSEQQSQRMRAALEAAERRARTAEARLAEAEAALQRARAGGQAPRPQQPAPQPSGQQTARGGDVQALQAQLVQAQRGGQALERALAEARGEVSQSRNELNRTRGQLNELNRRVSDLTSAVAQRDQEISALRASLRSGSAPARSAPAPQPTPQPAQPTRSLTLQPPAARAASGATSLVGAEALLVYYRDTLQRAAQNGRRRPALGAADLQKLQACVLRHTGALARVDGIWGLETTAALFTLDAEEAGWIIDCIENR